MMKIALVLSLSFHVIMFGLLMIGPFKQRHPHLVESGIVEIELAPLPTSMPSSDRTEKTSEKPDPAFQKKSVKRVSRTTPPSVSATASRSESLVYASELRAYIEKHRYFPQRALRLKQTGRVTLSITVNKKGDFSRVQITDASPFKLINQAAIDLVHGLGKFKPLPHLLGDRREFRVSLSYQIKGM